MTPEVEPILRTSPVRGIDTTSTAIRQQMVGGFYAVLKLILHQQEQLRMIDRQQRPPMSAANLDEEVSSLIQENKSRLAAEGLVTLEALRDELVRLFADDVGTLLAIAQPAGFPKGWVTTTVKPIQAYYDFLEAYEGLKNLQKAQIAAALARKKPGSRLLRAWAEMYVHPLQGLKP